MRAWTDVWLSPEFAAWVDGIEDETISRELAQRAEDFIQELPPAYRDVIWMVDVEEMKPADVEKLLPKVKLYGLKGNLDQLGGGATPPAKELAAFFKARKVNSTDVDTGKVVSKRVSRKEITNSSQEKVTDRKKAAKSAGHSIGAVTRVSTCHSLAPRSRAARSIFA